jgi:AcrR family transcriptional regulator
VAETRRAQQRRQLVDEITAEARRQLEAGGPAGVSWRSIARHVGLSPASLYTYFASLDELFTELLLRSYGALAAATTEALAAFADTPVGDRLLVGPLAYRRWALEHRAEFNLVFTDQIPGYAAEPGGPTVDAQVAVFRPMAATLAEARGVGREALGDDPARSPELETSLGLWGLFHGLTTLEVNHHLDWLDAAAVFEGRMRAALDAACLPAAAADTARRFERWAVRRRRGQARSSTTTGISRSVARS